MRPRHEAVRRRTVAVVALAPLLGASVAPPAVASPAEGGAAGPAAGEGAAEVRLLSGDVVTVRAFPDGHEGIEVDLAERNGKETVSYEILRRDSGTYVVPSDAWPLLPEILDPVHDRQSGETTRVSVATGGAQADTAVLGTAISADGRYVGFGTRAANLVPGDTNGAFDLFLHDRHTGVTERVSVAQDGTEANAGSTSAFTISADGALVAFMSGASNLVSADTNGQSDIFVRHRGEE